MPLHHCPKIDSRNVDFRSEAGEETHENPGGLHVGIDAPRVVASPELRYIARHLDLPPSETETLPPPLARAC